MHNNPLSRMFACIYAYMCVRARVCVLLVCMCVWVGGYVCVHVRERVLLMINYCFSTYSFLQNAVFVIEVL